MGNREHGTGSGDLDSRGITQHRAWMAKADRSCASEERRRSLTLAGSVRGAAGSLPHAPQIFWKRGAPGLAAESQTPLRDTTKRDRQSGHLTAAYVSYWLTKPPAETPVSTRSCRAIAAAGRGCEKGATTMRTIGNEKRNREALATNICWSHQIAERLQGPSVGRHAWASAKHEMGIDV